MPIGGFIANNNAPPVYASELSAMLQRMRVRENWEDQHHIGPQFGFVATAPAETADISIAEDIAVVCDTDLLNSRELAAELSVDAAGGAAELIAALFRRCGIDFLQRLRGSFAIAIWERAERTLILAVDRIGVKTLAYSAGSPIPVFASNPSAIFASGRIDARVNPQALVDYFTYTTVAAPLSAFDGVLKVEPGCWVSWKDGEWKSQHYWEMRYPEDARESTDQLAAEMITLMGDAVRVTSEGVSPTTTGCFLSGGTDSSSVVGLLARQQSVPVNTFSIGFNEDRFNELHYAHVAVKHFSTNHHERIIGPEDAFDFVPKIATLYDEPFGNSSVIPTYFCLELAREAGMKLMLAGDGGDEFFGGNERYRTDKVFQLYFELPSFLRKALLEPILNVLPEISIAGKAKRYVRACNTPQPERYVGWGVLQRYGGGTVLGPTLEPVLRRTDALAIMRSHYKTAPARSELNRLLYIDVKMTLGDNDLPKVVRTSEFAGVNVRFPYLDHPLAEFSGRLKTSLKVKGFKKRYLFKRATRELLPAEILSKKKHGFGLPVGMWLRKDPKFRSYSRDILLDPRTYQRGYFQRSFIEQLIAWMEADETPYFGDLLWLFMVLELWHRTHVDHAVKVTA